MRWEIIVLLLVPESLASCAAYGANGSYRSGQDRYVWGYFYSYRRRGRHAHYGAHYHRHYHEHLHRHRDHGDDRDND